MLLVCVCAGVRVGRELQQASAGVAEHRREAGHALLQHHAAHHGDPLHDAGRLLLHGRRQSGAVPALRTGRAHLYPLHVTNQTVRIHPHHTSHGTDTPTSHGITHTSHVTRYYIHITHQTVLHPHHTSDGTTPTSHIRRYLYTYNTHQTVWIHPHHTSDGTTPTSHITRYYTHITHHTVLHPHHTSDGTDTPTSHIRQYYTHITIRW